MKTLLIFALCFLVMPLQAAESQSSEVIQKDESQSAFKGVFYKIWNKFKTLSPKDTGQQVRNTTVTAGIRGAETTSSILQPYWKDDKTSDKAFMQQLEAFAQAQSMADSGDLQNAHQAFKQFIQKWPESDLKPNAQFAEALTSGAMGNADSSTQSLKSFMNDNPGHPLVQDAEALMGALQ